MPVGKPEPLDHTSLREERARILRVEAGLDRVTAALRPVRVEPVAVRYVELETDEIDAVGLLGHRVLDLDSAVQLEEVDVVARDEELDRARIRVTDGAGEQSGRLLQAPAGLGAEAGRRRLLDDLLVAALHRAVALAEDHQVPGGVGDDLHLDVARALEVALAEHGRVAERRLRLAPGGCKGVRRARPRRGRPACRGRRHPPPP